MNACTPIRLFAGLLTGLLAVVTPASAQYSPSASMSLASGYAGMASRLGAARLGREMLQREAGRPDHAATRPDPARPTASSILDIRFDQSIADEITERMADAAAERKMDDIAAGLRSGAPLKRTRQLLRDNHWDPDNVADVIAFHTLVAWQLVHDGADVDMESAEAIALRDAMRRSVSSFLPAQGWSNRDKTETAVFLTNMTAILIGGYHALVAEGAAGEMQQFQDGIQQANFLALDLRALQLTRRGPVPDR